MVSLFFVARLNRIELIRLLESLKNVYASICKYVEIFRNVTCVLACYTYMCEEH